MFELIMTACSAVEEDVWRSHLSQAIAVQTAAVAAGRSHVVQLQSPLANEIRSIGAAFGKPGSFVRRMSVHRSQTVGPTTDLNQVIIKNTQAVKDALSNSSAGSLQVLPRSQSVATPSHVQTLAPRRAERVKIESLLADVWSSTLPFPGMTIRRSEQLRGSANHVIRKLSMASITSTFYSSKRAGSQTSMTRLRTESESSRPFRREAIRENARPPRLPLSELLPADFDLSEQPSKQKRRNALRALTMTMERPFSPLMSSTEVPVLAHAHSVREPRNKSTVTSETSTQVGLDARQDRGSASNDIQDAAASFLSVDDNQTVFGLSEAITKKIKSKSRLRKLFS